MKVIAVLLGFYFFGSINVCHADDTPSFWVATSAPKNKRTVTKDDLKNIFLGNKILWNDGSRIIVCHLKSGSKSLNVFLTNFLEMSARQYDFYWKSKVFSGQGYPPRTFSTYEELVSFLKMEPRALGILDQDPKGELSVIYSAGDLIGLQSPGSYADTFLF